MINTRTSEILLFFISSSLFKNKKLWKKPKGEQQPRQHTAIYNLVCNVDARHSLAPPLEPPPGYTHSKIPAVELTRNTHYSVGVTRNTHYRVLK